jgi:hypothetical protein
VLGLGSPFPYVRKSSSFAKCRVVFLGSEPLGQASRPPTQFSFSPPFIRTVRQQPDLSSSDPSSFRLLFYRVNPQLCVPACFSSLLGFFLLHCAKKPRGERSKPQPHPTLIQPPCGTFGSSDLLWLQAKIFSLPLFLCLILQSNAGSINTRQHSALSIAAILILFVVPSVARTTFLATVFHRQLMFAQRRSVVVSCVFEPPLPYLAIDTVDSGKLLVLGHGVVTIIGESHHVSSFCACAGFFQLALSIVISFDHLDLFLEYPGKPSWFHPKVLPRLFESSVSSVLAFCSLPWRAQSASDGSTHSAVTLPIGNGSILVNHHFLSLGIPEPCPQVH